MEKFWEILRNVGKFWKNFATIYALSCGEKLSPKSTFVEKNDKYEVCLKVSTWICFLDLSKLFYYFFPLPNKTKLKISNLVEASALNLGC